MRAILRASIWCAGLALVVGCSGSGAAHSGFHIGKNLARKDSHLKIMLAGQVARQDKVKKAATGYSRFTIKEPVGTAPRIQFEIEDPDRFGRISMVSVQIHQKFEADYSDHAEYVITARDVNNPDAQMKPGVEYDLGHPGPNFKVINYKGEEVDGVRLVPGMKYMLVLTVKADRSETAQIFFQTN